MKRKRPARDEAAEPKGHPPDSGRESPELIDLLDHVLSKGVRVEGATPEAEPGPVTRPTMDEALGRPKRGARRRGGRKGRH